MEMRPGQQRASRHKRTESRQRTAEGSKQGNQQKETPHRHRRSNENAKYLRAWNRSLKRGERGKERGERRDLWKDKKSAKRWNPSPRRALQVERIQVTGYSSPSVEARRGGRARDGEGKAMSLAFYFKIQYVHNQNVLHTLYSILCTPYFVLHTLYSVPILTSAALVLPCS